MEFTEFGKSAFRNVLERVGRGWSRMQERSPLDYDLLESDDAYLVVFDAPGVSSEDVQVKFSDGSVEVRLDRFRDFFDGYDMRFPGRGLTLSGSAKLPRDASVRPAGATATITRAGTLHVHIPKDESETEVDVTDRESADAPAGDDLGAVVGDAAGDADGDGSPTEIEIGGSDEDGYGTDGGGTDADAGGDGS